MRTRILSLLILLATGATATAGLFLEEHQAPLERTIAASDITALQLTTEDGDVVIRGDAEATVVSISAVRRVWAGTEERAREVALEEISHSARVRMRSGDVQINGR